MHLIWGPPGDCPDLPFVLARECFISTSFTESAYDCGINSGLTSIGVIQQMLKHVQAPKKVDVITHSWAVS